MKFLHLADLHFGKSIHGVSLLENGDQPYWVERFLELVDETRPDAVLIAGDVYDRSAPSGDAVDLLSQMLTALAERTIPALLIAGNHDSAQRLAFVRTLLAREGVHIAGTLGATAELSRVTLNDEYGPVTFWLMPYVYPALIAQRLGEAGLRESDAAVRALLRHQGVDFTQRNVLLAHQNVTASGAEAIRGGSETMVGGVGQIDFSAFDGFDYVALGHIHAACAVGREGVRYAGSPLCYHFDETRQPAKGPLLVELGAKGAPLRITRRGLPALHPMRELRGSFEELRAALLAEEKRGEYLRVVLTDRRVTPEDAGFFRELLESRGSVLMEIASAYSAFRGETGALSTRAVREKSLEELFEAFYAERSGGVSPSAHDRELLRFAAQETRRGDWHADPTAAEITALLTFLERQEGKA